MLSSTSSFFSSESGGSGIGASQSLPTSSGAVTSSPATSKGGLSTSAKAGIGIAAAVVGLAIIGAIVYFDLRKRGRRSGEKEDDANGQPHTGKLELDGRQRRAEMEGHISRP